MAPGSLARPADVPRRALGLLAALATATALVALATWSTVAAPSLSSLAAPAWAVRNPALADVRPRRTPEHPQTACAARELYAPDEATALAAWVQQQWAPSDAALSAAAASADEHRNAAPTIWYAAYDDLDRAVLLVGHNLTGAAASPRALRCLWPSDPKQRGDLPTLTTPLDVLDRSVLCPLPPVPVMNGPITVAAVDGAVEDGPARKLAVAGADWMHDGSWPAQSHDARAAHAAVSVAPSDALHSLCIVTMVRNEASYLHEFIDYHWRLGVSFFLFFDNNSTDGTAAILRARADRGAHALLWPFRKSQAAAFAVGHLLTRALCDFTFFIDVDEFVSIGTRGRRTGAPLEALLKHSVANHDGPPVAQLCFRSKLFHSGGRIRRPTTPVIDSYLAVRPRLEPHRKCASRRAGQRPVSRIHDFVLLEGYETLHIDPDVVLINHYKEKSWEDYLRKYEGRAGLVSDWARPANVSVDRPRPGWGAGPEVIDSSVVAFRDHLVASCRPLPP